MRTMDAQHDLNVMGDITNCLWWNKWTSLSEESWFAMTYVTECNGAEYTFISYSQLYLNQYFYFNRAWFSRECCARRARFARILTFLSRTQIHFVWIV